MKRAHKGERKLSAITREMVGRVLADMERDGKAGATVNNVRALAHRPPYRPSRRWCFDSNASYVPASSRATCC